MISYDDLNKKFDTAKSTVENRMSKDDYKKFSTITDFVMIHSISHLVTVF